MKYCYLLFLFFVLNLNFIYSQSIIDSLKTELKIEKQDTIKINILEQIADKLLATSPDSSILFYKKALKIAKQEKYRKFQINIYSKTAKFYISQGNYQMAIDNYEIEKGLCKLYKDNDNLITSTGNSGVLYYYLSNYPEALINFYELEKIASELKDSSALSTAYTNIGMIYKTLHEESKALNYFIKSVNLAELINDKATISTGNNNIGLIYQTKDEDVKAIEYLKKALNISEELNDKESIVAEYINLGISYNALKKTEVSMEYFMNALKFAQEIDNKLAQTQAHYNLALIYEKEAEEEQNKIKQKKLISKTIFHGLKGYNFSKEINSLKLINKCAKLLARSYKKTNEIKKALKYANEYIELQDTLFSKKNIEAIQNMNAKHEIYKNRLELERKELELNKTIKNKNNIISISVFFSVFFLIFSFTLLYFLRKITTYKNSLLEAKSLQRKLIDNLPDSVFLKSKDLRYKLVNKTYANLLGVEINDIIGKSDITIDKKNYKLYESLDKQIIALDKSIFSVKYKFTDKSGNEKWVSTTKVPFHDKKGNVEGVIGIVSDISDQIRLNQRLQKLLDISRKQEKTIAKTNKNITDSIIYAKTIQDGLLPSKKLLDEMFNDYFIIYKAQNIVSGDFYYISKVKNKILFTLADCTGHGVSGAFMTMLSISFLNQIIHDRRNTKPSVILEELRLKINTTFEKSEKQNMNGLDIAFCAVDLNTNILEFAGAYISLFILRENEMLEYKASRIPIGSYYLEKDFENTKIQLKNNDILYMFTDGFADQLGGADHTKFSSKRLRKLIFENKDKKLSEQKQILENTVLNWQANFEQFDDISFFVTKWKI